MLRKKFSINIGDGLDLVVARSDSGCSKKVDLYITHKGEFLQALVEICPDYEMRYGEFMYNNDNFIVKIYEDADYDSFTKDITIPVKDYRRRTSKKIWDHIMQDDYIPQKVSKESWSKIYTSPVFGTYKLTYKMYKEGNKFKIQIENSLTDNIHTIKKSFRSYADAERWIKYLKDEIIDLNSEDLDNLIE